MPPASRGLQTPTCENADQHWNYEAASRATESIYGVRPDLTREGGSIPITLTFADTVRCFADLAQL